MSVFKVPGSPFYYYRFMFNARRYKGSTGETGPHKARQVENAKMEAVRRGEQISTRKMPRLDQFSVDFLRFVRESNEAGHRALKTRKYYENGCRLLSATRVWGMKLNQISSEDAAGLKFSGSPSNTNNALRTLRRMLNIAKKRKLLTSVPEIELLEENERQLVVQPWLEDLFLERSHSPLREIMIIMLDSFMRPDEVCRIQWPDIFWDESQIYIPTGKTKRARRFVPLTDRMRAELRQRQQENLDERGQPKSPWVFPSKRSESGHLMPGSLDKMFDQTRLRVARACIERRLPPIPEGLVLYSNRHTGLTNFNAAVGGDGAKVTRIAGHSDIRVSQKYLHPSVSDAAELMNRHNRAKLQLVKKESA